MAGFVDLERIASRADRALGRLDAGQTREIERYLTTALRRTLDQTQPLYARAMADADGAASNAAFRLARGRVLADEIDGTIRGLVGQPAGALDGMLARVASAREDARGFVEDTLRVFGDAVTISTPVNHRALSGVVEHAATRLYNHADVVVDRIKEDVLTGLVRGDSWAQVTRAIRDDAGYLRSRAEMIAITELHSAQADARQELYGDLGVELVIRYVTIDDRTCEYCAPRQGEVTKTGETTEVLHPRCRCILAPFDPEWALDDTLVPEQLEEMLADNLRQLEDLGIEPRYGAAPFERTRDRFNFRAGPAGRGRPEVVWRPGQPTSKLVPWLGRSFTNLGAFATDAARPIAPVATGPAAPIDPIEQARVLPSQARAKLATIDDEAAGLKAARDRLIADRDNLRDRYSDAATNMGRLDRQVLDLGRDLRRLETDIGILEGQIRSPILANQPPDVLRARLAELTTRKAQLEGELRAAQATAAGSRSTVTAMYDDLVRVRAELAEAMRTHDTFRQTRAHEILRNSVTGHPSGSVTVNPRMRDATLAGRAREAETWLADHTVLRIDHATDVRRLKKGARAYHRAGEVFVAPEDGVRTLVHELGHAVDHAHASLVQRAIAWRDSRTVGEAWQSLRSLTGNSNYAAYEVAKPDRFIHPYIGKSYGTRSTEVLSMGLEHMYADPIGLAKADSGMFDLIFRIMKGLPDP